MTAAGQRLVLVRASQARAGRAVAVDRGLEVKQVTGGAENMPLDRLAVADEAGAAKLQVAEGLEAEVE